MNRKIIDDIVLVTNEHAFEISRRVAALEGIPYEISSGASAWAALNIAERLQNKNKHIVVIPSDTGERYLSADLLKAG